MDTYNHFEYGEQLATQLKAISHTEKDPHFFPAIEEEEFTSLENQISSQKGMTLIAIDGSNADYQWQSENMTERPQYFFILVTNTNSNCTETIHQAQKSARLIAQQIIARMINDCSKYQYGLSTLDLNSIIIRGVGPLLDNFYGVLLGFNILNSFNYELNPDYWL